MLGALSDKIADLAIIFARVYRSKNVGTIDLFQPEKLMCGVLISRPDLIDDIISKLSSAFGPVDFRSGVIPFDYTNYYDEEMGTPIFRLFVAFEELVSPDRLPEIKKRTNKIEAEYTEDERRRVNLDPGLISLKRLILASTKDNGRRIPLTHGIYAEITLVFIDGCFQAVPWTYPDYRSDVYLEVMKGMREIYKDQLKRIRR
jgi:hypothetical protein